MTIDPYDPLALLRVPDTRFPWVPWEYPDANPMPEIVLFPRLHKVMRWFSR